MNSLDFLKTLAQKNDGDSLPASDWNKIIQALINGANTGFNSLHTATVEMLVDGEWQRVSGPEQQIAQMGYLFLDAGNTYRLSGYFNLKDINGITFFTIKDNQAVEAASSTIVLHNAFIQNDSGTLIKFPFESKALKVIVDANTENYIIGDTGERGACIYSVNNLEIAGTGYLGLYNKTGHGIKGSELNITGDVKIYANVAHDALHGTKITNIYWGQYYIDKAKDAVGSGERNSAEDAGKLRGIIRVFGGKFFINELTDGTVFDNKYIWMVHILEDGNEVYKSSLEYPLATAEELEDFNNIYVIHSGIFSNQNVSIEYLNSETEYELFGINKSSSTNYFRERLTTPIQEDEDLNVSFVGHVFNDGVEVQAVDGVYTCPGSNVIVKGNVEGKIVVNKAKVEIHLQRATLTGEVAIEYTSTSGQPQIVTDKYSEASYINGTIVSNNNIKITPKTDSNLYIRNCEEAVQASTINIINGAGNLYIVNTEKGIKGSEFYIGVEKDETRTDKAFTGKVYAFDNTECSIHARLNSSKNNKGTITMNALNEGTVYTDKVYIEKAVKETTKDTTGKITVDPDNKGNFYYQTLTHGGIAKGAIKYCNKVSGILNTYFE